MKSLIILFVLGAILGCQNNKSIKVLKSEIDTLNISGKVISFDSVNIANYSNIYLTDQASLIPQEKEAIDDTTNVKRLGERLSFKMKNGDTLSLINNKGNPMIDNGGDTSFVYYVYQKKTNEGFWAVSVIGDSWSLIQLINIKNGKVTKMTGMPVYSPNKELIISYSYAEIEGSFIELYKCSGTNITNVFVRQLDEWWPINIVWLNNDSVLINRNLYRNKIDYVKMNVK